MPSYRPPPLPVSHLSSSSLRNDKPPPLVADALILSSRRNRPLRRRRKGGGAAIAAGFVGIEGVGKMTRRSGAMEGEERRAYLSAWLYCCGGAFGSVGGLDIVATASYG